MKMSKEEIDKLPTILDVLEMISNMEVENMLKKVGVEYDFLRFDPGKYFVMTNSVSSQVPCLMPGSQSPFTLLRGQNRYYQNCQPSLYRVPEGYTQEEYELVNRIRMQEFLSVLMVHPVIREYQHNFELDGIALAQHYGFPTEYLDITNSKWVAAFFAVTEYKSDNSYVPVGRDFKEGVGVMYIYNLADNMIKSQPFFDKVKMVGFHYFNRPTSQNAIVLPMSSTENFNDNKLFKPIFFRHNLSASNLVYDMAYKQIRFFADDFASKVAHKINEPNYAFAWSSVSLCREQFGLQYTDEEIKEILTRHNIHWHTEAIPYAGFDVEQMSKDWEDWNRYGRENFRRRIVQMPLIAPFP